MQYLDTLPEEVLELILKRLKNPVDLINCSRAHPRLDEELRKWKGLYLFPHVLPLIANKLAVKDALKIPDVCDEWRDAAGDFDNHIPGRQPYDDELYLNYMKTLGRDPGEHKWKTDIWFLSFNNIGRDLRCFETELRNHPEKIPFRIGRSAYFEISHNEWQIQQIYLRKLELLLQSYGSHLWYVKLKLTVTYALRVNQLENCAFIRLVLGNLPNARYIEIEVDIDDAGGYVSTVEQVLIPHLPQLESLLLSFGKRNSELRERHVIAKHVEHLKKLKLTARPGNLPRQMPCLVELYIHGIQSKDIFEDLNLLQAPLLQKLHLGLQNDFCQFDKADMLEKMAHLPLRQLIIQWGYANRTVNDHGIFRSIDFKFREIQFPLLHTLSIYNFPDDWHPLLVCFPSLTYLNIRITSPGTIDQYAHPILRKRDELLIRKIMYGVEERLVRYPEGIDKRDFPKLEQVSTEMWKTYGYGVPGELVRSKKWKRNLKRK